MRRESEIRQHFPEAWIEDYEDLITAMTNHPNDRHVLAAAAHAGVKVIVTYNIKDFPRSSITPYSITAQGPSAFLRDLYRAAPAMVMQTLEDQAATIGQSLSYLLSRLRINAPAFVDMIRHTCRSIAGRHCGSDQQCRVESVHEARRLMVIASS